MTECLIKCRKCRHVLGTIHDPDSALLSSHGQPIDFDARLRSSCSPQIRESNLYFRDEALPSWISSEIESSGWTRGKLHCPGNCGARVGSFDFVSCPRCECQECLTPNAHLIMARVDISMKSLRPLPGSGATISESEADIKI